MPIERYPPGPLTWEEIVAHIRALPERIEYTDVATVAILAGILGVFGFPEGSQFREEKTEQEEEN